MRVLHVTSEILALFDRERLHSLLGNLVLFASAEAALLRAVAELLFLELGRVLHLFAVRLELLCGTSAAAAGLTSASCLALAIFLCRVLLARGREDLWAGSTSG